MDAVLHEESAAHATDLFSRPLLPGAPPPPNICSWGLEDPQKQVEEHEVQAKEKIAKIGIPLMH